MTNPTSNPRKQTYGMGLSHSLVTRHPSPVTRSHMRGISGLRPQHLTPINILIIIIIFHFFLPALSFVEGFIFHSKAQPPHTFSYQAVVRDAGGELVKEQTVGMQISILQGSETGTAVYSETHQKNTNANGLVSLEIGNGTAVSGNFADIDWADGPYFIKTVSRPKIGLHKTLRKWN